MVRRLHIVISMRYAASLACAISILAQDSNFDI